MKKPYTGVLAEPMQYGEATVIDFAERYAALRDHYGLAPSDDIGLALALARDHVPGFQMKLREQASKPDEGQAGIDFVIACVMAAEAEEVKPNFSAAARRLEKRYPQWGMSWQTVRQRWYDMRGGQRGRLQRVLSFLRIRHSLKKL